MLSVFSHKKSLCDFCFPWALLQLISAQANEQVFKVTVSVSLNNMEVYRRVPLAEEHLHLAFIFLFFN